MLLSLLSGDFSRYRSQSYPLESLSFETVNSLCEQMLTGGEGGVRGVQGRGRKKRKKPRRDSLKLIRSGKIVSHQRMFQVNDFLIEQLSSAHAHPYFRNPDQTQICLFEIQPLLENV